MHAGGEVASLEKTNVGPNTTVVSETRREKEPGDLEGLMLSHQISQNSLLKRWAS